VLTKTTIDQVFDICLGCWNEEKN